MRQNIKKGDVEMQRIRFRDLKTTDLFVDAIYESDRDALPGALSAEPLNKLMGVGNLGGFRTRRGSNGIIYAVITSTGVEAAWPDSLDTFNGTYTYFGDNRTPGREMHDTKPRGNALLRDAFYLAHSGTSELRSQCPLFFIFEWAGTARDYVFRGLAVPGSESLPPGEDLVAVWRTSNGERFQNYRATLSILDEARISGTWVRESLAAGKFLLEHPEAPKSLVDWVHKGRLRVLRAERIETRQVDEQLPSTRGGLDIIDEIYMYCSDDPWKFEPVAAEIWRLSSPSPVTFEITQKFRDGGRDAVGAMLVGPKSDPISLSFALEAKLYSRGNSVGVREISRLISRIKHREFGVIVTPGSVGKQAYEEVRSDGHPIVIITGSDIVDILQSNGISSPEQVKVWLESIS